MLICLIYGLLATISLACTTISQSSFNVTINNNPETLTSTLFACSNPDSFSTSTGGSASVGIFWSVYRFNEGPEYTTSTWKNQMSCPYFCRTVSCGTECAESPTQPCFAVNHIVPDQVQDLCNQVQSKEGSTDSSDDPSNMAYKLWMLMAIEYSAAFDMLKKKEIPTSNYCYTLVPTEPQSGQAYTPQLLGHFIPINWAALYPNSPNGTIYTIKAPLQGQNYSDTGLLQSVSSDTLDPTTLYYFSTNYSLNTQASLSTFTDIPTAYTNDPDLDLNCFFWKHPSIGSEFVSDASDQEPIVSMNYTSTPTQVGFHYYTVTGPGANNITNIFNYQILQISGLTSPGVVITVMDPCNTVFVTLYPQVNGVLMYNQTLQYPPCIIVQDSSNANSLHLYQASNGTNILTPCNMFTGFLSPNLVSSATISIITNFSFVTQETYINSTASLTFYPEPSLTISTSQNSSCQVSISSNCSATANISTSNPFTYPLQDCLPLNQKIVWVCSGFSNSIPTPSNMSDLNTTTVVTSAVLALLPALEATATQFTVTWEDEFSDFLTDWSWEAILEKIACLILLSLIIYPIAKCTVRAL